jgi:hypothetical protein
MSADDGPEDREDLDGQAEEVEHEALDLESAIRDFRNRHERAPNRQEAIQLYCCQELAERGIDGAEIEVPLPGHYRTKVWDIGLIEDGEPRLAISCKSIVSNHGGTVPNRIDDMLGEAVNLHRAYPKAVIGWLFMMSRVDESARVRKRTEALGGMTAERRDALARDGDIWFERLVESTSAAANRSSYDDYPEKFEVLSCSQIEFDLEPLVIRLPSGATSPDAMFDRLASIYRERFEG